MLNVRRRTDTTPRTARTALFTVICGLLTTFGAVGIALVTVTTPASAAGCATSEAHRGQIETSVPWAQQRYGLERLNGIADGTGQLVAVVDSGVDVTHPQLADAVVAGIDSLDPQGNGQVDCVGHGTAVSSIIAARPASGVGFRGIAPGAKIMPVRVSERQEIDGTANGRAVSMQGLARGIVEAVDRDVDILNLSLVTSENDDALRQAIEYAVNHDVVVVAAAGNQHAAGDPIPYPAAYPGVIGVGAIGPGGERAADSQVGAYVDLVAPGEQIVAAALGRGHATYRGTSFAVPFVAAAAALVRQYHPALSASQVAARLTATADPAPGEPGSPEYGAGVVNPYRAVTGQVTDTSGRLAGVAPLQASPGRTAARAARTRNLALAVAGACCAVALVFTALAIALPHGARRRWRPERPSPAGRIR